MMDYITNNAKGREFAEDGSLIDRPCRNEEEARLWSNLDAEDEDDRQWLF